MTIYISFKKLDYDKLQVKIISKGPIFHLHIVNTSYSHICDSNYSPFFILSLYFNWYVTAIYYIYTKTK